MIKKFSQDAKLNRRYKRRPLLLLRSAQGQMLPRLEAMLQSINIDGRDKVQGGIKTVPSPFRITILAGTGNHPVFLGQACLLPYYKPEREAEINITYK